MIYKTLLLPLVLAAELTAQVASAPAAPQQQAIQLTKAEDTERQLLQTQLQLLQTQINDALRSHNAAVNAFVEDTLKAHGNPKDVVWDPVNYQFKKQEPAKKESDASKPKTDAKK